MTTVQYFDPLYSRILDWTSRWFNTTKFYWNSWNNLPTRNFQGLIMESFCWENLWNPEILFGSDKYIGLKASLLETLLKRDNLLLDEIVIWDSLIKWCFAQHSLIFYKILRNGMKKKSQRWRVLFVDLFH